MTPHSARTASRLRGQPIKSNRRFIHLSLLPALVSLAVGGAQPAQAVDYAWLGDVGNGNWFSNSFFSNGTFKFNWSPSGPPPYGQPANVFIDANPAKASVVQIAPFTFISTPNCTGLACGVSAAARVLTIDAGDTVVIGGSAAYGDNAAYFNNGQARLEMIDTGAGASIVNNGLLRLSSDGPNAVLAIQGLVTLSGTGETFLGNGYDASNARTSFNQNGIIYGTSSTYGLTAPSQLVIAAGHTVHGAGRLGYSGTLAITNHGLIKADGPGELQVNGLGYFPTGRPYPLVNDGIMRAENGGRMWIMSRVDNTGGTIEALAGSTVELTDAVKGGTLRSVGTGVVKTSGTNGFATYLTGVTIEGRLTVPDGVHANFGLDGATNTIVNNGTMAVGVRPVGAVGNAFGSTLTLYGDTTFSGNGRIEFTDSVSNRFSGYPGFLLRYPVATLNAGQTLTGTYQLNTELMNYGRIEANGAINAVTIGTIGSGSSGGKLTNRGELIVNGAAPTAFQVTNGQFINEGTFTVAAGSGFLGNVTQTAGVTTVQGTMQDGIFFLKGGLLKGTGDFFGSINNTGGTFAPGNSPGSSTVVNYSQTAGDLVLEIDGDDTSVRDHLTIYGNASFIGGRIVIDLTDYHGSGTPVLNDLLTVYGTLRLKSANPAITTTTSIEILGLAPGLTANAAWNGNSLDVIVTTPVPEPETYALLLAGVGLVGLAARRRRRSG